MLSEKTSAALDGFVGNIQAAQTFVKDASFEDFKRDLETYYSPTPALEMVSEAELSAAKRHTGPGGSIT